MSQETQSNPTPKRRRGGVPVFAVLLIVAGVVLLLQTTGVLPWEIWGNMWKLWPVLIIALGISVMFGGRFPWVAGTLIAVLFVAAVAFVLLFIPVSSTVTVTSMQQALADVDDVDVHISFGAGELTVNSLPLGSPSLVEATFVGREAKTSFERSQDSADLNINMDGVGFPFWGDFDNIDWTINLSGNTELTIDLDGGAADMNIDLSRLRVIELDVNTGAADVEIIMPANAGHVDAEIDAGASDLRIVIPQGVAARIEADVVAGSLDVDRGRFQRVGDVYESLGFVTAPNRIDLNIDAGASSVTIR